LRKAWCGIFFGATVKIWKVLLWVVIGIAGLDLVFGNTNKPVLPDFLGNVLTQGVDAVLIGLAVLLLVFL